MTLKKIIIIMFLTLAVSVNSCKPRQDTSTRNEDASKISKKISLFIKGSSSVRLSIYKHGQKLEAALVHSEIILKIFSADNLRQITVENKMSLIKSVKLTNEQNEIIWVGNLNGNVYSINGKYFQFQTIKNEKVAKFFESGS